MAIPFGALRGAARRGLFRQYAQARWAPGITARTILNETRAIGLSIRRTDALSIIREMAGREMSRSTIRFVPDERGPGIQMFAETRLRLQQRFQTIFEVRGRNVLTNEPAIRRVSFISNERVSLGEMKRQLLEQVQREYAPREGIDYYEIVPVEGLIRADPPFTTES